MREIKFRAWHKKEKKMYEVVSIRFGAQHGMARGDLVNYVELDSKSRVYIVSDEVELLQFTGQLDRNSKEVYEGDILWTENEQPEDYPVAEHYRGIVTYSEKGHYYIKQSDSSYRPQLSNYAIVSFEVIGNIYENPELP